MNVIQNVDYDTLDRAKNAFIAASKSTLNFASKFGFVPGESLGASANIFSLNLAPFIASGTESIFVTLIPEGLGTADDARPEDLSSDESREFWYNIGVKTLSSLTNDASASGLQTILVGLYLPSSTPELVFNEDFMQGFLTGFVDSCREVGCVYLSGETPQLKNKIFEGKLDIAGALFALSPPGRKPVDSNALSEGDHIVMVESSGPHENGFTVLRELTKSLKNGYRTKLKSGQEFWRAINAPSKLYTGFVQSIISAGIEPTALENVTGHGWQKIMRSGRKFRYNIREMLSFTEIFSFVQEQAGYTSKEILKIFNCGTGFVVFVKTKSEADQVVKIAGQHKLKAVIAGQVEASSKREVVIEPLKVTLTDDEFALKRA